MHRTILILFITPLLMHCSGPTESADDDEPTPTTLFRQVTNTHLPQSGLSGGSMDARPVDVDADGDPVGPAKGQRSLGLFGLIGGHQSTLCAGGGHCKCVGCASG